MVNVWFLLLILFLVFTVIYILQWTSFIIKGKKSYEDNIEEYVKLKKEKDSLVFGGIFLCLIFSGLFLYSYSKNIETKEEIEKNYTSSIIKKYALIKNTTFVRLNKFTGNWFNEESSEKIDGAINEVKEIKDGIVGIVKDTKKILKNEIPADKVIEKNGFIVYVDEENKFVSGTVVARDKTAIETYEVKDGLLNGEMLSYKIINGKEILVAEGHAKKGALHGKQVEYYDNGEKEMVIEYSGGEKNGDYKSYYENGKVKEKGEYKNNLKTGKWKTYYPNGELESQGKYGKDKKKGVWKYYNQNGDLVEKKRHSFLGISLGN